ncbi:uncharacterized protein [Arachis hypogaea]|uniref:uncharacterized protein n=1 Tax=Arachis hypogaea TaxID=3818 RepID=UPI003B2231AD
MPLYAKFMKELLTNKRNWKESETVVLTKECSAIIQKDLPEKMQDPGSFFIPCTIGDITIKRALRDLGDSINLMPLFLMRKLQIGEVKSTRISLQLADRSIKFPLGVVENLLVKVGPFIFSADFVILDMKEDKNASVILKKSFLAIGRALIDVQKRELTLRVNEEEVVLNVLETLQHPSDSKGCMRVDLIEQLIQEVSEAEKLDGVLEPSSEDGLLEIDDSPPQERESHTTSIEEGPPNLELKPLPTSLKYAFLGEHDSYPVIISSSLRHEEEEALLQVLKIYKMALGWTISDLKGINPTKCLHMILLEEDAKPVLQPQRQLNPTIKEVAKKEVMKLWKACASDSRERGVTVVKNEKNELIPTRIFTWWHMSMLVSTPIMAPPSWGLPFELMCDASDHATGAVLGQGQDKLVHMAPWFADIANYKAMRFIPKEYTKQQVKKLLNDAKYFLWEEPYLFKRYSDGIIQCCVSDKET